MSPLLLFIIIKLLGLPILYYIRKPKTVVMTYHKKKKKGKKK